jgi:hypothetical protein
MIHVYPMTKKKIKNNQEESKCSSTLDAKLVIPLVLLQSFDSHFYLVLDSLHVLVHTLQMPL